MNERVSGRARDREQANEIVEQLEAAGFSRDDVLVREQRGGNNLVVLVSVSDGRAAARAREILKPFDIEETDRLSGTRPGFVPIPNPSSAFGIARRKWKARRLASGNRGATASKSKQR
jgi:hypothetical protein